MSRREWAQKGAEALMELILDNHLIHHDEEIEDHCQAIMLTASDLKALAKGVRDGDGMLMRDAMDLMEEPP